MLHSAVRMLGCTILQSNTNHTGLKHEVQGYSTTAYFEGWAVSVDSVIDCSVLRCLPVVLGSLIIVSQMNSKDSTWDLADTKVCHLRPAGKPKGGWM